MIRAHALTKCSLTAIALVLSLAGCQQSGPSAGYPGYDAAQVSDLPRMIDTDQPSYPMGSRVSIRLVNRTGRAVSYNLCGSSLERLHSEGDWRPARETLADTCTAELRTLAPGQAAAFTFDAQTRSPPGQYRVRTVLQGFGDRARLDVVSNSFMLTRDGD